MSVASTLARQRVVAAAVDVFTKLGVAQTRVEDLLAAAQIARRTFYKYFTSKEDVLAALYVAATDQLLGLLDTAEADHARDAQAEFFALRTALDAYLDFHVANARLLRLLVEQSIVSDSPLAPLRKRFRARLVKELDGAVRRAQKRQLDPLVFHAILASLEGLSLLLLEQKPTPEMIARTKAVMHALVDRMLELPKPARLPEIA